MARIVVFQHSDAQNAGRLGLTLRDHGFRLDFRRPDLHAEAAIPPDLDNVQGVLVLGGRQNVTDGLAWLDREIDFVRRAHEAQIPVLGICLGAQVIARALGGEVAPMAKPEVGFTKVDIVGPGQIDRILAGVRWTSQQFQSHGQEVTKLPPGATLLASSAQCKVQAFCAGIRTYAFQYHFEPDRKEIDGFFDRNKEMFEGAGVDRDTLSKQCDEHYSGFARLADRLCVNIASFCFSFEELMKA